MVKGKILLVVTDEANRTKYDHYLKNITPFDLASGLNEAYQQCLKSYYDLILVDLKLSLGHGRLYIEKLNSLSHSPSILKIRPRQDQVDVLLMEQRAVERLDIFLQKFFAKLQEEEILAANARKYKRYRSILRVLIRQDHSSDFLRANTLNISQGGMFITTIFPFQPDLRLEVQIHDVAPEPIQAVIRVAWMRPWDVPHQLPGIGVQFLSFAPESDQYVVMDYLNKYHEQHRGDK
ncbi:MAG: PilZ domain-containing protein [bacterium]